LSKAKKLKCQVATIICQSASQSRDAEALARSSRDKKVNWVILVSLDRREVAVAGNMRVVVRQHGARELLDLAEEGGLPAKRVPCDRGRLDPAAYRSVPHGPSYEAAPVYHVVAMCVLRLLQGVMQGVHIGI
jgi:hypothetical protein